MGGVRINQGTKAGIPKPGLAGKANQAITTTKKGLQKLGLKAKETFFSELSILLSSGIDIKESFHLLKDLAISKKYGNTINSIEQQIIEGGSLFKAMETTGSFNMFDCYSVKIGEETGKLPKVLKEVAGYYERRRKQQRLMAQAMVYPAVVVLTSFITIFIMLSYVVPMFSDIYKRTGGDLPYLTQVVIASSDFLRSNILIFLLIPAVLGFAIYKLKSRTWFKKLSSSFALNVPILKDMIKLSYKARLCNSLSVLLDSNIPINQALALTKEMVTFYPVTIALGRISEEMIQGSSLSQSMSRYSLFDKRMIAVIKVGEETNKINELLDQMTKQYATELEFKSSVLNTVLEPLIIVVLGLFVSVILVSLYLPIFEISNTIK